MEKNFNAADIAFAFAMPVCGFLYWNLIRLSMPGAGVTVFAATIFAATYLYLSKSEFKQNRESLAFLILAGLSAVQFALFDNQLIKGLNFLFLSALFIYWICLSTNRRIDKTLSAYIIGDAVNQGVSTPFLNFGCCASGIKSFSKYGKVKGIAPALAGILIFLPLIALVLRLLISADFAFEGLIRRIRVLADLEKMIPYILQFIFGLPVAFYLYGLIYGNVKGRYADRITAESVDKAVKMMKIAPKPAIYSALTVFNGIYFLFFAVQAPYLFSAFNGNLPDAFTYAEYARRGFFELCAVAGINLGVLIVSHLAMERGPEEDPKVLRVETITISMFTLLLITTALSKMAIYIHAFGLTQLRVFTSWFMLLLLFIFTVICVRQFKPFNSAKLMIAGSIVMFMLLSYGNVDGFIAQYNIGRYEAGTLPALDMDMIAGLSDAAVPRIYELYRKTDEQDTETRQWLASAIMNRGSGRAGGFREFNVQRRRADEIRAIFAAAIMSRD